MTTQIEIAIKRIERYRKTNRDAFRLARLASLAVRVEPCLLRRLRLELLPEADVGVEADLWFSPLVESRSAEAIVLNHHVVDVLREDLATNRKLFLQVKKITEASHVSAPPSIRLEENLNMLALQNEGDVVAAVNEALRPALRALKEGGDRAVEIAHWVFRALPRFHPMVRQSPNALSLLLSAQLMLGSRILRETPDTSIAIQDVAWVLPEEILNNRISLGAELIEQGIRFFEAESDSPAIDLPRTTPLLVGLAWEHRGKRLEMLVEAEPGRTFDLESDVSAVTVKTLAGDEFLLEIDEASATVTDRPDLKKTCFVIQGLGKQTDLRTGRTFDLDASYEVIKEAVENAGLICIRADEIRHSQVIDKPMYEHLLNADLVIADLSTSNINTAYELGVRHALRPRTTIIVAEDKWDFSFDINRSAILSYEHLGTDLSFKEAKRFSTELTRAIKTYLEDEDMVDSPIYTFLPNLAEAGYSDMDAASRITETIGTQLKHEKGDYGSGTCFVIQGFGKKTDFRTGRTLDLDASYQVIKEAVENAGLACIRADEIQHSQVVIDKPMYEYLLNADLVIADLSTSNINTAYELGVRHALRPRTTIIVAENKWDFPFDINRSAILSYEHLGTNLGRKEAKRFSKALSAAIMKTLGKAKEVDSPLYHHIPNLTPPVLRDAAVFSEALKK